MNRKRILIISGVVTLFGLLSFAGGAGAKGKMEQISQATKLSTAEAGTGAGAPAKGWVWVRGRTVCDTPVVSPLSGKQCLSFAYAARANFSERVVDKADPTKTKLESRCRDLGDGKEVAQFALDDGSGPVRIDAAAGGDVEMVDSPEQSYLANAANEPRVMLGNLAYSVTGFPSGTRFTATERLLLPSETMFACGRLENGVLGSAA